MKTVFIALFLLALVLVNGASLSKANVRARKAQLQTRAMESMRLHLLNTPGADPATPAHDKSHFTYKCKEGDEEHNKHHACPAHWGLVEVPDPKGTGGALLTNECAKTDRQSPIDLPAFAGVADVTTNQLVPGYSAIALAGSKVFNNGHTVQVNLPKDNANHVILKIGTVEHRYNLLQFHFHAPSEHKIGGAPACMEMHMVHQIATPVTGVDELLAVGVMFQSGEAVNSDLSCIFDALPAAPVAPAKETVATLTAGEINPATFITNAGLSIDKFWSYKGSLTTPPCSEKVDWFVLEGKAKLGTAQLEAFKAVLPEHENARPTQNANNKSKVYKRG